MGSYDTAGCDLEKPGQVNRLFIDTILKGTGLMSDRILQVADDFWNIRGSFKIGGLVDIGTQASSRLFDLLRRVPGTIRARLLY